MVQLCPWQLLRLSSHLWIHHDDTPGIVEGMSSSDRTILEKDAELEIMRKKKSEQRDYFKKLEEGKIDNQEYKEPKLMVGRIKDKIADGEDFNEDVPEMASVASRFTFFEKQKEREEEEKQKRKSRKTPPRLSKSHIVSCTKL